MAQNVEMRCLEDEAATLLAGRLPVLQGAGVSCGPTLELYVQAQASAGAGRSRSKHDSLSLGLRRCGSPSAGHSKAAVGAGEKAAVGGADTSADIDAFPGATLADKLAAATAQHP